VKKLPSEKTSKSSRSGLRFDHDRVALLETNIDDVSGETIAHTIDELIGKGAMDASAVLFIGKKGRPGFTIRVTCSPNSTDRFVQMLFRELGTFGVKVVTVDRIKTSKRERSVTLEVGGRTFHPRVKVATQRGLFRIKPEFDDASAIAKETSIPLRRILELIYEQANERVV
jgi:uncharacterized protein (DUF111 family)